MIQQTEGKRDEFETYDVIVVGAGVSGLTAANILTTSGAKVLILEQDKKPGGLIRCENIRGNLHHLVGGHVFNTRLDAVSEYFWKNVCKRSDFTSARRDARILLNGEQIPYPIENNLGSLGKNIASEAINDLLEISNANGSAYLTFGEFLLGTFGRTLCELYFFPYNKKIWQLDPREMAIEWLAGKLPMPTISEILLSNTIKTNETGMAHDSFFYPKNNGSQHIVNNLIRDVNVRVNEAVRLIEFQKDGGILINKNIRTRFLVYTGNVRNLPMILAENILHQEVVDSLRSLKSHGTTNVLSSCEPSTASWTYLPDPSIRAHRIINTGLFSTNNTSKELRAKGLSTCVLEFTGYIPLTEATHEIHKIKGLKDVISYNYREETYVLHDFSTKKTILRAKEILSKHNICLLGRFGEWEYYNMDTAMQASISIANQIIKKL